MARMDAAFRKIVKNILVRIVRKWPWRNARDRMKNAEKICMNTVTMNIRTEKMR